MTNPNHWLLVRMLRYQGKLSDADLERIVEEAESCEDLTSLVDLILKANVVDREWLDRACRYLRGRCRTRRAEAEELHQFDRKFGQIAMRKGWIGIAELEQALLEQERLRRTNLHFRIGEILVRQGALSVEAVREILSEQRYHVLACQDCEILVQIEQGRRSGAPVTLVCPDCGGKLVETRFLDLVHADRMISG